jgi:hypothetical protein
VEGTANRGHSRQPAKGTRGGRLLLTKMRVAKPPFDYGMLLAQLKIFLPCEHAKAEPRKKRKNGSGRPYYRIQCPDCGAPLSSQLAFTIVEDFKMTFGPIRNWDHTKEAAWLEHRLHFRRLLADHQNWERHYWWWREYGAYLGSSEWLLRRVRIFHRCNRICEMCSSAPATQVHHLTYERVGEELDTDLLGVCGPCHDTMHHEWPNDAPAPASKARSQSAVPHALRYAASAERVN